MSGGVDLEQRSDTWWNDVWRDGNLDAVFDLFTDPFRRHASTGSETLTPREYRDRLANNHRLLARAATTIGDRVWTRATTRGLNLETGERSVLTWLLVQRFEQDRIAEQWTATISGIEWEPERPHRG